LSKRLEKEMRLRKNLQKKKRYPCFFNKFRLL
jgi:hypothetical protein